MSRNSPPDDEGAAPFVPDTSSLAKLAEASRECHGCPLWQSATQTVFGEGRRTARLLLVGEQPGDQEDRRGHPFVGPPVGCCGSAWPTPGSPQRTST